MKRSAQIFNKVQEMSHADDEDEYDQQCHTQPARPTKSHQSPLRPGKLHAGSDAAALKRVPHRSSMPTQKSLYQQDSSQVVSRQARVSFINAVKAISVMKAKPQKENAAAAKFVVESNMVGNKDIYKQVALSPSRAPEIIFGNLRHNHLQFRQNVLNKQEHAKLAAEASLVERRESRPWAGAGETKKAQQQRTGAYVSQMSVNSGLARSSLDRNDSIH